MPRPGVESIPFTYHANALATEIPGRNEIDSSSGSIFIPVSGSKGKFSNELTKFSLSARKIKLAIWETRI